MTREELLRPRFKVIADYPDSPFNVGNHLYRNDSGEDGFGKRYWYSLCPTRNPPLDKIYLTGVVENYPHLFKKLEWWEERAPDDLPMYVSNIGKSHFHKIHFIPKWNDWSGEFQIKDEYDGDIITANFRHFLPATEAEYNEHLKM